MVVVERMLEGRDMGRYSSIAIVIVLAGELFAHPADAGGLAFIEGTWNNSGGDNIQITPDQLGGWTAWLGAFGQGNIIQSTYRGGNIKVEATNVRCWFRATVLSGGAVMNWQLKAAEGNCSSLEGHFTRIAN